MVFDTAGNGRGSAAAVEPHPGTWSVLVAPPRGTASVVATPSGGFDAAETHQSALSVDALTAQGWKHVQTLHVQIPYGSSG